MTCIVSIKEGNKTYIGGDSAAVAGLSVSVRNDSKVFRNKQMLIGFAGSFRMGQIVRFAFKPPKYEKEKDIYEYMCVDVMKSLQKAFEKNGFNGENKKSEKETAGQMLIAYKGQLYEIDVDYQVGIPAEKYSSIGCGSDLALGALYALDAANSDLTPEQKITIALDAACKFNGGVLPPYNIMSI
jgi:ATP-dependent protease HslVU (ClpYQ) peptidase subunit